MISNVTNSSQAQVTVPSHGYTLADVDITSVMFKQVKGMLPINGMPGVIQSVIDSNNFIVNINTTNFPIYRSGGVVITDTGEPPTQTVGFQTFNTPWQNVAKTN
jgi:hypothetical protein